MIGNSAKGLVLQKRDRHLLLEIGIMRIVDREAVRQVAPFGSATRANVRLLALVRKGLLRRFFIGTAAGGMKALYALSPSGARLVGVTAMGPRRSRDEVIVADFFVAHQMSVNEIYCDFKYGFGRPSELQFRRWIAFTSPLEKSVPLVPDGYLECAWSSGSLLAAFVEADLGHERHAIWLAKVRNYLKYATSGRFEEKFGAKRFLVLVVTDSPGRMESLRSATAKLTDKIFRFTTLEAIRQERVSAPIWLKPNGNEPVSLSPKP